MWIMWFFFYYFKIEWPIQKWTNKIKPFGRLNIILFQQPQMRHQCPNVDDMVKYCTLVYTNKICHVEYFVCIFFYYYFIWQRHKVLIKKKFHSHIKQIKAFWKFEEYILENNIISKINKFLIYLLMKIIRKINFVMMNS